MTRKYRKTPDGKRFLVRKHPDYPTIDGFEVKWTDACTGCNDYEDGHLIAGPFGCHECGYTGKRVRCEWVPFDLDEYLKVLEADQ